MTLVSLNSLNIGAIFCKSNLVADRAGFEPTSPAPKAGRISRLP